MIEVVFEPEEIESILVNGKNDKYYKMTKENHGVVEADRLLQLLSGAAKGKRLFVNFHRYGKQ